MIKPETYCANCHWQYQRHYHNSHSPRGAYGTTTIECPNPEGLYATGIGTFSEGVPIHGPQGAVEAVDAEEEPFDPLRIWAMQRVGVSVIAALALLIALLGGIYIGHILWVL